MLKHASPLRSSQGQSQSSCRGSPEQNTPSPSPHTHRDSYSERGVDCDSLVVPASFARAEKAAGYQVGTWSGVSQANVRRGLSFNSRRAPDSLSFRSVRSEGHPVAESPAVQASSSMTNVSDVKRDDSGGTCEPAVQYIKGEMTSIKSLLRLPGVRGHAKIVEVTKDGVLLSPETLSLNSSDSYFSGNSGRTSSRSWSSNASSNSSGTNASSGSNSSTSEPTSTTIRVFAKCLRSDIEYKTISVNTRASCREVVALLLSKYRMRHRDPNLFYLTMEVTVRRCSGAPVRSLLVLEDGAKPAQLALCRPPGDSRFALQMRRGGVVKIHDTVLMPGSQYKSLLVSDRTTAEDVVQLMLTCYNRKDNKAYYAIHEVRRSPEFSDRLIQADERLLDVKARWPRDRQSEFVFVLRRNMSQALSLRKLALRTAEMKWMSDGLSEGAGGHVTTPIPTQLTHNQHPSQPINLNHYPPPPTSQPSNPKQPPPSTTSQNIHQNQPSTSTTSSSTSQPLKPIQPTIHHPPSTNQSTSHVQHAFPSSTLSQPPKATQSTNQKPPPPSVTQSQPLKPASKPVSVPPTKPNRPVLEGAVIDCTEVTPKMTAINRGQPHPNPPANPPNTHKQHPVHHAPTNPHTNQLNPHIQHPPITHDSTRKQTHSPTTHCVPKPNPAHTYPNQLIHESTQALIHKPSPTHPAHSNPLLNPSKPLPTHINPPSYCTQPTPHPNPLHGNPNQPTRVPTHPNPTVTHPTNANQPQALTRDSATNTEIKAVSNNSTQTILTKKTTSQTPQMSSPPPYPPPPPPTETWGPAATRRIQEDDRGSNGVRVKYTEGEDEDSCLPSSNPSSSSSSISSSSSSSSTNTIIACTTSSVIATSSSLQDSATNTSCTSSIQASNTTTITSCTASSSACKHNCQHCFYI